MATTDAHAGVVEGRRPSIEKKPVVVSKPEELSLDHKHPSAFERLPDEIVQQILQATDSDGFASLALLNTKWRSVAQQAHLYACHLASCPSYAASHSGPPQATTDHDLPRLRRLFAREVKRNLFEAYLRPTRTTIKVISNSISSSSCPGGEGIQFNPSPKGHHLLAYNSSRIHVVDLRAPEISVKREFKILRRPAATCINDEGTMLAVLQTEMEVDIYDLTQTPPKRTQSMILDHSPRAIALSPCGSVLVAAYEGGIEVSSLNPGALATDRRAVKCDGVDALTFSFDGTQILGTTVQSSQPSTVILTAPYYDPGSHVADDNISALWTTSILFPNTSRDCSHAVLIQDGKYEEAAWTFTYDRSFETFRAVRVDDLRNGTTYFTGPVPSPQSQAKLLPCTLPAASYNGELVSAGFHGKDIWLYGIPADLDAPPDVASPGAEGGSNASGLLRRNSGPSVRSTARLQENSESARVPQWQILCDKLRNTFVTGYKIGELEGVNTVKFVAGFGDSCIKERLVVAARGAVPNVSVADEEGIDFVDGGRITILDFDYGVKDGSAKDFTIEVGSKEPEVLEEEHRDIATEVAIVRRRTVAQKRGLRSAAVMRNVTNASRPPPLPTQFSTAPKDVDDPLVPRRIGAPPARGAGPCTANDETETQSIEEQEALDAPYAHASPRSGTTLRRAATAAANTRRLHPSAAAGHIVYRRADGRAEHPHESDADNWVPPPPPYQKEDPGDLPSFLRHTAILPRASAQPPQEPRPPAVDRQAIRNSSASMHRQSHRTKTAASANRHSAVPPVPPLPSLSDIPPVPPMPDLPPGIVGPPVPPPVRPAPQPPSHGCGRSPEVPSSHEDAKRPTSRGSRYLEGENIYDVSPPDSPTMPPVGYVPRAPSNSLAVSGPQPPIPTTLAPPAPAPTSAEGVVRTAVTSQRAAVLPERNRPPTLGLQIPGHIAGNMVAPTTNVQDPKGPSIRRLSVSRTWPIQPAGPVSNKPAATGYPYSAPPVNNSEARAQVSHPLPRNGPPPASSNGTSVPRPLSGSLALPCIPVDNPMGGEHNRRRTSYQRPISQQQHYSLPRQAQGQLLTSRTTVREPQAQQQHNMSPVPPGEDMPLIISTPKGVSGAFDPPERHPSERRAETPILAPIPRHPRPQTQASILRPPPHEQQQQQQHLQSIYSGNSSAPSAGHRHPAQGSSNLHHVLPPPLPPLPPVPPTTVGPGSGLGSGSGSVSTFLWRRVPNLGRRQSRAERSAARNMADAKRRGWGGGSSTTRDRSRRKKKKEREFDPAGSAVWSDVTACSVASLPAGRRAAGGGGNIDGGRGGGRAVQRVRERRCVVM